MKIAANTFFWTLFVCAVGLSQIGIIYLSSLFNDGAQINMIDFYSDGFFLFFTISLISGIFYEFVFESVCRIPKPYRNFLMIFSGLIGFFAMLVYALAFSSKIQTPNSLDNYISFQHWITSAAITVTVAMKAVIYYSR